MTMVLSSVWLAGGGVVLIALALALWPMARTRVALLTWGAIDLLLSLMAASSRTDIFTLLYAGAAYAVAFGAFQLSAGLWIWCTAAPEVAPTGPSRWRAASSL